jgi:epsilon-lactone hydrolase
MGAFRVPATLVRLGARQISRRAFDPRLPWEVQRRRLDRLVRSWPLRRGTSVTKTALNGVRVEVVTATGAPAVTVVHFHGGGYCVGSPAEARDWAAYLSARAECRVILPDYRLAPEHPYPAALEDARAVMRAVLAEREPGAVVVSGDSAGGGLAMVIAQGEPRLAGCMLISPWLDLTADWSADPELARRDVILTPVWLEACAKAYAPEADRAQPAISPLHGDLEALPPLLIQCGTDDLVAPDAERLAVLATAAGVDVTATPWPRLWHNFPLQPDLLAAANAAVTEAASFIARVSDTG